MFLVFFYLTNIKNNGNIETDTALVALQFKKKERKVKKMGSKIEKIAIRCWIAALIIVSGMLVGIALFLPDTPSTSEISTEVEVPALGMAENSTEDVGQGSNSRPAITLETEDSLDGDPQATIPAVASRQTPSSSGNHGETISEVIENLRYEPYEIIVVFTADGQKLFEQTSQQKDYALLEDEQFQQLKQVEGEILIHNHPNADVPFSSTDLWLCSQLEVGQGIVVSRDHIYSIEVKDRYEWSNPDAMYNYSTNAGYLGPAYARVETGPDGKEIRYTTDALLFHLADKFHLVYSKQPLD